MWPPELWVQILYTKRGECCLPGDFSDSRIGVWMARERQLFFYLLISGSGEENTRVSSLEIRIGPHPAASRSRNSLCFRHKGTLGKVEIPSHTLSKCTMTLFLFQKKTNFTLLSVPPSWMEDTSLFRGKSGNLGFAKFSLSQPLQVSTKIL